MSEKPRKKLLPGQTDYDAQNLPLFDVLNGTIGNDSIDNDLPVVSTQEQADNYLQKLNEQYPIVSILSDSVDQILEKDFMLFQGSIAGESNIETDFARIVKESIKNENWKSVDTYFGFLGPDRLKTTNHYGIMMALKHQLVGFSWLDIGEKLSEFNGNVDERLEFIKSIPDELKIKFLGNIFLMDQYLNDGLISQEDFDKIHNTYCTEWFNILKDILGEEKAFQLLGNKEELLKYAKDNLSEEKYYELFGDELSAMVFIDGLDVDFDTKQKLYLSVFFKHLDPYKGGVLRIFPREALIKDLLQRLGK